MDVLGDFLIMGTSIAVVVWVLMLLLSGQR